MFKIGQKVVCIKDSVWFCADPNEKRRSTTPDPTKGEIYTITKILSEEDGYYLKLAELCPITAYWSKNFRPVLDIGDEVEIYIKSLQPVETLETV